MLKTRFVALVVAILFSVTSVAKITEVPPSKTRSAVNSAVDYVLNHYIVVSGISIATLAAAYWFIATRNQPAQAPQDMRVARGLFLAKIAHDRFNDARNNPPPGSLVLTQAESRILAMEQRAQKPKTVVKTVREKPKMSPNVDALEELVFRLDLAVLTNNNEVAAALYEEIVAKLIELAPEEMAEASSLEFFWKLFKLLDAKQLAYMIDVLSVDQFQAIFLCFDSLDGVDLEVIKQRFDCILEALSESTPGILQFANIRLVLAKKRCLVAAIGENPWPRLEGLDAFEFKIMTVLARLEFHSKDDKELLIAIREFKKSMRKR